MSLMDPIVFVVAIVVAIVVVVVFFVVVVTLYIFFCASLVYDQYVCAAVHWIHANMLHIRHSNTKTMQ